MENVKNIIDKGFENANVDFNKLMATHFEKSKLVYKLIVKIRAIEIKEEVRRNVEKFEKGN